MNAKAPKDKTSLDRLVTVLSVSSRRVEHLTGPEDAAAVTELLWSSIDAIYAELGEWLGYPGMTVRLSDALVVLSVAMRSGTRPKLAYQRALRRVTQGLKDARRIAEERAEAAFAEQVS